MIIAIMSIVGHFFGKRQFAGDAGIFLFILACVEFNTFDEYVIKVLGA